MKFMKIIFIVTLLASLPVMAAERSSRQGIVVVKDVTSHSQSVESPRLSRELVSTPVRIITGFAQLFLTIALGLAIVYISLLMIMKLTHNIDDIDELKKSNNAVGILIGSFIFGVLLLVKRTLYPAFAVMEDLIRSPDFSFSLLGSTLLYFTGYLVISLTTALMIAILSLKLFDILTKKIDEFEEIRKNNSAVAIYFASVYLSLCFFIEEGLHALLVALLPLPTII
jgi:uncharacterized membrane protein YjfL (UPF0719 family)